MTFKQILDRLVWLYAVKTGIVLLGKPDAPETPDYVGAAREQAAANLAAARTSAKMSNPTVRNQYGQRTVTYGYNGDPDQALVEERLNPQAQQLFDQQQRINTQLGGIAEQGIGRVGGMFGSPFDMSNVTARPDINNTLSRDQVTKSIIERNQPMMDRNRAQLENRLSNQGIFQGSEAYKNAMDDLARKENDFNLAAIGEGGAEQSRLASLQQGLRDKDIQTQAYLRSLPLNELNSLRSGIQVSTPQFQGVQGQNIQGAPILNALQAQNQADMNRYGANVQQYNNMMGTLFNLGSAALFSDHRLKENIKHIGTTDGGLPIYTYNYIWDKTPQMGVIAQDVEKVMPEAVIEHESGYKMVDYSKVR